MAVDKQMSPASLSCLFVGGGGEERGVGGSECLNVCVRVAVVLL